MDSPHLSNSICWKRCVSLSIIRTRFRTRYGGVNMVTFCSQCKAFCNVDYSKKQAICSRCGEVQNIEAPPEIRNTKLVYENIVVVTNSLKQMNGLSRRVCSCPKCGNKEAYVSIVGARNEEDYETEKLRCTECGYSWRESS